MLVNFENKVFNYLKVFFFLEKQLNLDIQSLGKTSILVIHNLDSTQNHLYTVCGKSNNFMNIQHLMFKGTFKHKPHNL